MKSLIEAKDIIFVFCVIMLDIDFLKKLMILLGIKLEMMF